ncbi:ABC transporter permease [Paenibacillus sp. ACRRX]|uniref:ABC transporter permease n=1 Tax=unclassified Paenibacillus TaxID=185978 RepID=UPI001EF6A6B1|nr:MULTISPECIES: ABC transporter permease [unclassified Paenibacillus]MCG7408922.1 ABC transporter permease [Paenibacillus sp. ACRRX]MDK8182167.1 ABC transporter permease [Paenibacillus sp. UMB4589-SE434]
MLNWKWLWFDFSGIFWRSHAQLVKLPIYLLTSIATPLIWLLLFSQIFQPVIHTGQFSEFGDNYLLFFAPGVVVMTTLFGAGWSGMGVLADISTGVIEKIISTPSNRSAVILGKLSHQAMVIIMQAVIVMVIAILMGAQGSLNIGTALGIAGFGYLMSIGIAAISYGVALLVRHTDSMMVIVNLSLMPMQFLSSTMMPMSSLPKWIQVVSYFNPVDWYVVVVRTLWLKGWEWDILLRPGLCIFGLSIAGMIFCSYVFNRALSGDWR